MDAVDEIVNGLENIETRHELDLLKSRICSKHKISMMLNSEILSRITSPTSHQLQLLKTKPVRSRSGVTVVAVMTHPFKCPGKCIYCPEVENVPKSYTGEEPAAMRGKMFNYDPHLQVKNRLDQLRATGHNPNKVEIIAMGGNFTSHPFEYQEEFAKRCFDAMNGSDSETLEQSQEKNETADIRCIGFTVEFRPDWCNQEKINQILKIGATRVELGVQTLDNSILEKIKRGHSVEDTIKATQILRDSGYKINYHLMPNLPGSNPEKDLKTLKELFENPEFRPDMLKIYPTLVIKGTKLYDMWKKGEYKPYTEEEFIDLMVKFKSVVPKWVRIMRVQRDIPLNLTEKNIEIGNLREIIHKRMKEKNLDCNCIRCRQAGHKSLDISKVKLKRTDYEANNGKEIFLSFEDKNTLVGFLRLRIPYKPFRKEITNKTALVRELHVYGTQVQVGEEGEIQHKGFGSKLLKEAEKIAKQEFEMEKMIVISGIGVREYYYKQGYSKDGPYVSKFL
jgi:elongator complex protein 3